MTRVSLRNVLWLGLLVGLLWAVPAGALPVNHGTFVGTDVDFEDVTETTQSADDECLFTTTNGAVDGACATAPIVAGNQLLFFPTGFTASTTGGGADTTASLLSMFIQSTGSGIIPSLVISEFGDTVLAGSGTAVTETEVAMIGTLTVMEVDGTFGFNTSCFIDFGAACVIPFTATYSPSNTFDLVSDPGATNWSATVNVDLLGFDATKIQLQLDNQLDAFSEASSSALIQKKVVSVAAITVPEPGTALLGIGGLLGFLLARRSR
ncbi:MAG: PEP-CTERM sorting domain-containing protein [bacterium]|nr:PEP-CTERM sorting domain-containing protein [bacterium]